MSQKSSPKIIKIDLEPQKFKVQKKHRKKIEVTKTKSKTKYTSPQDVRKLQKSLSSTKKQLSIPQIKQNSLIQSDVKLFEINQFSFSQEIQDKYHKIQDRSYENLAKENEIVRKIQHQKQNSLTQKLQKVGFIELNVGIKIFELCQKRYQDEILTIGDCTILRRNLDKGLKAIYGQKNPTLIMRKSSEIVESFKIIFNRKRSLFLHEVIMFLVDCNLMTQLIQAMFDIFPNQIKSF